MKKRDLKHLVSKHDHIIETLTMTLKELVIENKNVNSNLNKLSTDLTSYKSSLDKLKSVESNYEKVLDKLTKLEHDRELSNKRFDDIMNNLAKIEKFRWFLVVSVVGALVGAFFKLILKV